MADYGLCTCGRADCYAKPLADAFRDMIAGHSTPDTCAWRLAKPINLWNTACGMGVSWDDVASLDMPYCGYCGRKIVDAVPVAD